MQPKLARDAKSAWIPSLETSRYTRCHFQDLQNEILLTPITFNKKVILGKVLARKFSILPTLLLIPLTYVFFV